MTTLESFLEYFQETKGKQSHKLWLTKLKISSNALQIELQIRKFSYNGIQDITNQQVNHVLPLWRTLPSP